LGKTWWRGNEHFYGDEGNDMFYGMDDDYLLGHADGERSEGRNGTDSARSCETMIGIL